MKVSEFRRAARDAIDHHASAEIYQALQRKGVGIRSIIDCVISAVGMETGAVILHKDRDFDYIANHLPVIVEIAWARRFNF